MYEHLQKSTENRSKHDWSLSPHVVLVVAIAVAIVVPFAYLGSIMYRYQVFKQDLAASIALAEHDGSLAQSQANRFYTMLVDAGMGKPQTAVPEEGGARIEFGDGSALELWEVAIDGNPENPGTLIRYTRADGDVFCYDTDKIEYQVAMDTLGLA